VDGSATTAEFAEPNGLAIDKARNLYVADFFNNVIRKISSTGAVTTYAGSGLAGKVDGPAATASFHNPSGITIDDSGNLYVAEAINNAIRQIAPGGQVSTFATVSGAIRVTLDGAGNLYASCNNNTIKKIANDGMVSTYAGDGTPGYSDTSLLLSEFNAPAGILANSQGVLIVADYGNNRIRVVTP
jgi:streptogramin lyase